jgi:hypothetical protein
VLAVAVALVLAGCGGGVGVEAPGTASPTISPAPVPTAPATPGARLAPGVTREGVVVPGALLAAHRERLVGTAYRTDRLRLRIRGGTVSSRVSTVARYDGTGRYLVERTISGSDTDRLGTATRVEQYADAEAGYRRRVVGDRRAVYSTVGISPAPGPEPTAVLADPLAGRDVVLAFSAVRARVVTRERAGGTTTLTLAGEGLRSREALRAYLGRSNVSTVRNLSIRATVTGDGLVTSLAVRYTIRVDGRTERVLRRARFSGVGTTEVQRPAWYDTAAARTG